MKLLPFFRRQPKFSRYIGALIDSTGILLTVSANPAVLTLLQEWTTDTSSIAIANYPNYPDPFFLESLAPTRYPEWTWDKSRIFKRTRNELVTERLREQARLANEKGRVLESVIVGISRSR